MLRTHAPPTPHAPTPAPCSAGHHRTPSGASSSHRRTLSAASSGGGFGGGTDFFDQGSMPNTPSRVEGPERSVVAGGLREGGTIGGEGGGGQGAGKQALAGWPHSTLAAPMACRVPPACRCCRRAGFVGELEGELSVEAGERVKVHSEVDGWARVIRLSDHRTGLVPSWAVGAD